MSWSKQHEDSKGNSVNCLTDCKHGDTCHIPKITGDIVSLMSSVDVGTDGHMAVGTAHLRCNGFERVEAGESESASVTPGASGGDAA